MAIPLTLKYFGADPIGFRNWIVLVTLSWMLLTDFYDAVIFSSWFGFSLLSEKSKMPRCLILIHELALVIQDTNCADVTEIISMQGITILA